jgi:two-component system OmpR family response regulator
MPVTDCRDSTHDGGRPVPHPSLTWPLLHERSEVDRDLYGARPVPILLIEFDGAEAISVAAVLEDAGLSICIAPRIDNRLPTEGSAFDAVIIGAPGARAAELCEHLRSAGYSGPLVVVGTRDETSGSVAALEKGADDFVAKPFDSPELLARIRAVQRRAFAHSRLRAGVVALDRSERIAYLRDRPLRLTAREYALLACLVEANGKMLTRAELLRRVWRRESDPGSNLVEAHLSRLRDKLGGDAPLIETVRRGGYRFRP